MVSAFAAPPFALSVLQLVLGSFDHHQKRCKDNQVDGGRSCSRVAWQLAFEEIFVGFLATILCWPTEINTSRNCLNGLMVVRQQWCRGARNWERKQFLCYWDFSLFWLHPPAPPHLRSDSTVTMGLSTLMYGWRTATLCYMLDIMFQEGF